MVRNRDASRLHLAFFGDSVCVGQGVSIYNGWVTRIAGRLEALTEDSECDVIVTNASVNGNTTRQALERMPYEVQSHGVDVLLVQFGLNDCNYWLSDNGLPRVSKAGFAANLREIIDRGRRFGAKKIFLHNNHPTSRDREILPNTSLTYEQSNREYNAVVRDVAENADQDVIFTDIEKAFLDIVCGNRNLLEEFLLPDGLHLSRRGHDVYLEVAGEKIESCVRELLDA